MTRSIAISRKLTAGVAVICALAVFGASAGPALEEILSEFAQGLGRSTRFVSAVAVRVTEADETRVPSAMKPLASAAVRGAAERIEVSATKTATSGAKLKGYAQAVRTEGYAEGKHGTDWRAIVGGLKEINDEINQSLSRLVDSRSLRSIIGPRIEPPQDALDLSRSIVALAKNESPRREVELAAVDRVAIEYSNLGAQLQALSRALLGKWERLNRSNGDPK